MKTKRIISPVFWRSRWAAYLLAAALTISALGARVAINSWLSGPTLILFTIPIILSAYWGGIGPGLLATLISGLGAAYYILPPLHSFNILAPTHRLNESMLCLTGLVISSICEALQRSRRRLEFNFAAIESARDELRAALKDTGDLRTALDEHAIVSVTDTQGKITFVNNKFCTTSKYSREELIGQDHRVINSGHHSKAFIQDLWATIASGKVWQGEFKIKAKDGSFRWLDTTIVPFLGLDRKPQQYIAIRADITSRKQSELELAQISWLYDALSHINQAIVRMPNRDEMFRRICQVLVEHGRFHMAWIGWHDPATRRLLPVAECGDGDHYLQSIKIYTDDRPEGRGPTGTAFREQRTFVCNDLLNDLSTLPWREEVRRQGWRASASFPFRMQGEVCGTLTVYAVEPGFFHQKEVALLEEAASDISFALGNIAREAARQQAEAARSASEKKLSMVLENMTEGVMLIDAKGNAFYQNPASLRIHGFEKGETGHIKNQDLPIHWKGWDEQGRSLGVEEWPLSRVTRGEWVQNQVLRARREGTDLEFFANYNGRQICDESGRFVLGFITIHDITEQKRAEEALRESEDRFRTMANSMSQLAWIARADGFIFWYNQRWYDYTGTTPEQMEGWGWQSVHDPKILPQVMENWQEAIATGLPFDMEFPLRGADGHFRSFLTRGQPLKNSEGKVVQWFGINTDVDELKRLGESLRATQSRLSSTLLAGSIGTWTWDIVNDRLIADEFTARAFSVEAKAAAQGLSVAVYLRAVLEEDQPAVSASLAQAIQSCGHYDVEYRVRQKDGTLLWLLARGWVEGNAAGKAVNFHGAVLDVTARKQAEEEIRQLNAELEQRVIERTAQLEAANKELESFSYSVSHDLRAPLRAVNGFAKIVLDTYAPQLPAEARELLADIRAGGQQMGQLIDDLLAFSRLGRQPLNRQPVDTARLVQVVLDELAMQHKGRPVEIKVSPLPACQGDPALLKQVWVNLIANAIKYTRGRTPAVIEIGCHQNPIETVYFVRDNGAGFDMRYAHKLFGVFQRLHRAEEFEGTGVGLAIVQRIIHRHGGRVWAESKAGLRTDFQFTLGEKT